MPACMALGSLPALISYIGFAHLVAIVTAVTSGVTSYMEFHSTDKKLVRYNATIVGLEKALLWWNGLTEIERASHKNANLLVCMCEDTIRNERSSWMATAQQMSTTTDDSNERRGGGTNEAQAERKTARKKAL